MRALLVCVAVLCARPLRADGSAGSAAPPNPARRKQLLDNLVFQLNYLKSERRLIVVTFLFDWRNLYKIWDHKGAGKIIDPKIVSPLVQKILDLGAGGIVNREALEAVLGEQLDAEARSAKSLWRPDQTSCPTLVKASDPDDACSSVIDAELCQRLRDNFVPGATSLDFSATKSRGLVQFVTCVLHKLNEPPKREGGVDDNPFARLINREHPTRSSWPTVDKWAEFLGRLLFWVAVPAFIILMLRGDASWRDVSGWLFFSRPSLLRVTCLCVLAAIKLVVRGHMPHQEMKCYSALLGIMPPGDFFLHYMVRGVSFGLPAIGASFFIYSHQVTLQAVSALFRRFRRGPVDGHFYGALLCGAFVWWYSLSLPGAVFFTYLQCCKTGAGVPRQWRRYVMGAIAVRGLFSDGPIIFGILLPATYWYLIDAEPEFFDADYVGWCVAFLLVLLAGTSSGGTSKPLGELVSELVYRVVGFVALCLFANTVGHDLVRAQESLDTGKRQRKTAARDRKAAVAARREAEAEQRRRAAEEKAAKAERNRLAAEAKAAESERKLRAARNDAALARARKAREEQEAREREKRDARAAALAREEAAAAEAEQKRRARAKAVEDERQRLAAEAKAAESERKLRAAEAKVAEEKRRRELAAAEDERRRLAAEAKAALAERKLRAAQKKAEEEIRRREAAAAAEAERERRAAAKIAEYEQRRAAEAARAHEETKGETVVEGADPVVAVFLASLDLSALLPRFVEESVDADVLPCLTAEDLAAMGVRMGPARKILAGIKRQVIGAKKLVTQDDLDDAAVHQATLEAALADHRAEARTRAQIRFHEGATHRLMCTQVSKLRTVLGTVPDAFVCPITQEIMKEPTMAADGFSYERVYIAQWLSTANTSPKTGAVLPHVLLTPNLNLKTQIGDWLDEKKALKIAVEEE